MVAPASVRFECRTYAVLKLISSRDSEAYGDREDAKPSIV
jgi:hypothetical protein